VPPAGDHSSSGEKISRLCGHKGGKKGGLARAARLTAEQRSASARKAVQARWAKTKPGAAASRPISAVPTADTSRAALHDCLDRLKAAKDDSEIRRLTEELQQIVFHKQYRNAEN
jgi:hypothetical protein